MDIRDQVTEQGITVKEKPELYGLLHLTPESADQIITLVRADVLRGLKEKIEKLPVNEFAKSCVLALIDKEIGGKNEPERD